ncbi:hypothetical protein H310_14878 [Aphanomyces invadans]|uniref:Tc1-like transposase DDE domain-containing protein n=1 Tax=Aphanomyces invadans TaxID=157072 RepID=A0A024T8I4_9STRA|nr:hypothetical protein H310_14878 [Aphanomyces invadans]ETV90299.1 hypothetical protein H310_14878 [Aphanomyces invadans]|eukprot:XP_008881063.1 hypothetical protein H310_14878 [Aphanomyces invadans]
MWPIVKRQPAARSSRNRAAGTIVTTLVNVDAAVNRDYVISKVIPAIKLKFPSLTKCVFLQHDNATPHAAITDEVLASVSTDGWVFRVRRQPLNSPDLNVLDLGIFASTQAMQLKTFCQSVDDIIQATLQAFDSLDIEKIENVFLALQAVMQLVLQHHGENNFRLPHLKKAALTRAGVLMANVSCPESLVV